MPTYPSGDVEVPLIDTATGQPLPPGLYVSGGFTMTLKAGVIEPKLTKLDPHWSVPAPGGPVVIDVHGEHFVGGDVVEFDGQVQSTTVLGSGLIRFEASRGLDAVGAKPVKVLRGEPGTEAYKESNALSFAVANEDPTPPPPPAGTPPARGVGGRAPAPPSPSRPEPARPGA